MERVFGSQARLLRIGLATMKALRIACDELQHVWVYPLYWYTNNNVVFFLYCNDIIRFTVTHGHLQHQTSCLTAYTLPGLGGLIFNHLYLSLLKEPMLSALALLIPQSGTQQHCFYFVANIENRSLMEVFNKKTNSIAVSWTPLTLFDIIFFVQNSNPDSVFFPIFLVTILKLNFIMYTFQLAVT